MKVLYPITYDFVVRQVEEPPPELEEDFSFIISIVKDTYTLDFLPGQALDFTIDWGDGTETVVDSTSVYQYIHIYPDPGQWKVTIKNYVSGWFYFNGSGAMRQVLTPFPKQIGRTDFTDCFRFCLYLTSIPEKLFINCMDAVNFSGCFDSCYYLTSIPEGLFANCVNAIDFSWCFNWTKITSIPEGLFANCVNAIDFSWCFSDNIYLTTIPDKIFDNNINVTNFNMCFTFCENISSAVPELWLRTDPTPSGLRCYEGVVNAANYDQIPDDWK